MAAHYGYALDPGFKSLLASVGVRHQDVLRRAGLPEDLLHRSDARVTPTQFFAFGRAIEDSVDDPTFPVLLAENVGAESFSPPVFAALCSPNLTVALERLAMFKPLVAPLRLGVNTRADGLHVTFHWLESPLGPPPFLSASEVLFLVKLARMGTRQRIEPIEVTMSQRPDAPAAHEAFLGCPIRLGHPTSVLFRSRDATRRFLTDNSAMWDIFEPQLRKRLADLEGSASFTSRVQAVLIEALPSGQASVESVAQRLAVSSRTLQRRLRDEATSFNAVVRGTRRELAEYYLGRTQLSFGEIAYLLGFEEPNSFFRAFQAWTGTTPDAFRRSRRA